MTYEEQLKDKRWWLFREIILCRDNKQCTRCGSTEHLQAHHLYYSSGSMAWDYPYEALVTLCKRCHEIAHGKMGVNSRAGNVSHIRNVMLDFIENMSNHGK